MQDERTMCRHTWFHGQRHEVVLCREVGHRLSPISLQRGRQGGDDLSVQHHAGQSPLDEARRRPAHPVSTSVFSMLKLSISPTTAPLTGRISPTDSTKVSGTKIADSS